MMMYPLPSAICSNHCSGPHKAAFLNVFLILFFSFVLLLGSYCLYGWINFCTPNSFCVPPPFLTYSSTSLVIRLLTSNPNATGWPLPYSLILLTCVTAQHLSPTRDFHPCYILATLHHLIPGSLLNPPPWVSKLFL